MQRVDIDKMDVKKNRPAMTTSKLNAKSLVHSFGEIKQELKKIEWTSKEELLTYTKVVLVSTFVFGMFVYFVDLAIRGFLGIINVVMKFFIG